jgi:regulator of sirC expression with transglutaminase-like and TPR domain
VAHDPSARFAELVRGPEASLALDEAALLIAAHAHPGLDVDAQRARLDALATACPASSLDAVLHHLFVVEGFAGNRREYGDVRNSFLDDVLDRRLGIPITLSVVLMEVGRRLGLPVEGVGLPGHFLARSGDVFIDAFDRGRLLDREACVALFQRIGGSAATFDDRLLQPVGPRAILARMLANLRAGYASSADGRAVAWVGRLRALLPGMAPGDQAEQARLLVNLGRFGEAADVLEQLAALADADQAERLELEAGLLRARLN